MDQEETQYTKTYRNNNIDKITRKHFSFQYVIGRGGFGKVNI